MTCVPSWPEHACSPLLSFACFSAHSHLVGFVQVNEDVTGSEGSGSDSSEGSSDGLDMESSEGDSDEDSGSADEDTDPKRRSKSGAMPGASKKVSSSCHTMCRHSRLSWQAGVGAHCALHSLTQPQQLVHASPQVARCAGELITSCAHSAALQPCSPISTANLQA